MEKPIRWGVLGCAGIARKAMLPAILSAGNAELYAISSRTSEKLKAYAEMFPVQRTYIGYDALLRDPEVEAVYIPLANSLHCKWVIEAIRAGKPVLCEKPLAMTAAEVAEIRRESLRCGVPVMEAFAYLHDPMTRRIVEIVSSGAIGKLCYMEANFSYFLNDKTNVRLVREVGGGAIYDLGCYPVGFFRWLAGEEPDQIRVLGELGRETKVDENVLFQMHFPGGAVASSYCSFKTDWHTYNLVLGETGSIEFPTIFDRGDRKTIRIRTAEGVAEESFDTGTRYALQVEQMGRVIRNSEAPFVSLEYSLGNAEAMDRILAACGYCNG